MSLRALAAILRRPDPDGGGEPVLARILDAELNQLSVLVGEMTTALRLESTDPGAGRRPVDLARALETAVRRSGNRALAELSGPAWTDGHPAVLAQVMMSALALAFRTAEGRVTARTAADGGHASISLRFPQGAGRSTWTRFSPRVTLLRRIVVLEGGRLEIDRDGDLAEIRLSFPARVRSPAGRSPAGARA